MIVNAAGLAAADGVRGVIAAANWLYWLFALVPLVTIPVAWTIARGGKAPEAAAVQAAE